MLRWVSIALGLLIGGASAQQWIQVPNCGNTPTGVNPSAATIAVNPSGQVCILGATPNVNIATPLAVTVEGSAAGASPVSVSGTFTSSQTGNNITQWVGQQLGSPSTYGVAPTGSAPGVNAFVTNQPTVVLSGSPVSVGLVGSPITVVGNFATNQTTVAITQGQAAGASPVAVSGNFSSTQTGNNIVQWVGQQLGSPSTYGVAPTGSAPGVNAFVTNQPTVVLSGSPVSVGQAGSPISVDVGNQPTVNAIVTNSPIVVLSGSPVSVGLSGTPASVVITNQASPQSFVGNVSSNVVQLAGQTLASPTNYGVTPVGSVQGVNAFVTNQPTVVLSGSPVSVGLSGSPISVDIGNSPTVILSGSPVSVGLSGSPVAINAPDGGLVTIGATNNSVATSGTIFGNNTVVSILKGLLTNIQTPIAVTPQGSPVSVVVTNTPTVNPNGSPAGASPVSITGNISTSQTGNNIVQWVGQQLGSPSTYGVAPTGSAPGVNAFITNQPTVVLSGSPVSVALPGTPASVDVANSPTVVLSGSPVSVGLAGSPASVVFGATASINLIQLQGQTLASPSTYGVAPVGSTTGVNAFVTNGNPNGSATSANSQPVVIASDQTPVTIVPNGSLAGASPVAVIIAPATASPLSVALAKGSLAGATPVMVGQTLPAAPLVAAWTATTNFAISTPVTQIIAGSAAATHQLGGIQCSASALGGPILTPATVFLQVFDATSGTVVPGTSLPKRVVALAISSGSVGIFAPPPPGEQYTTGLSVVATTGPKNNTALGQNLTCSFDYN